jgi:LysM repeat protein
MTYVVQPGDTLAAITIRFDVTVEALRFANPNLDLNALAVGQSVVIPGVVDTATLEAEIASLSATLETLRGLVGTATATPMVSTSTPIPAVLCTVMSSQAINLRSRSTHDAAIVAQLPANTEMRVSAVEIGSADNVTWYRVETEVDGTTIRGGFVRSDQVEEITPCPTL